MSATAPVEAWFPSNALTREWLSAGAPQLVATMRRYLLQLTTFLAPRSVEVADTTRRQFARWLTTSTDVTVVAGITRGHVEDYKVWLAAQPGQKGKLLAKNTQRHRLRMIRICLERLIEWDWPDAPGRNPILHGDIPPRSEPLPKFLTDQQAAAFMAAARNHPVARYRLVAQVLARTGLRASELGARLDGSLDPHAAKGTPWSGSTSGTSMSSCLPTLTLMSRTSWPPTSRQPCAKSPMT
jgi:integrase